MNALRKQYRADLESDLATYEITDTATLKGFYQSLVMLDMADDEIQGRPGRSGQDPAMEDKEAAKLMGGLASRAYIAAKERGDRFGHPGKIPGRLPTGSWKPGSYALPYRVVQDRVKADKARAEYMSENLLRGVIQSQIEPAAKAMGGLSSDLAGTVIGMRYSIDHRLVLNPGHRQRSIPNTWMPTRWKRPTSGRSAN